MKKNLSEGLTTARKIMGNKSAKTSQGNWKPDSASDSCDSCDAPFSLLRRRHHCRNCGGLFCDACTQNRSQVPNLSSVESLRVCGVCSLRLGALYSAPTSTRSSHHSQRAGSDMQVRNATIPSPKRSHSAITYSPTRNREN